MVKPDLRTWWEKEIDKGIKLTKFRILHHEKHGNGSVVIEDKRRLEKQERHKVTRGQP